MPKRAAPLIVSLLILGCEAEPPAVVASSTQPLTPARTAVVTEPAWTAPIDREVESRLSAAARAEAAKSPVPVLAPSNIALANNAIVTTGPVWAAVSATADGVTFALHASKLAYEYGDIAPVDGDRVLRGAKGFVTAESNIWQASWSEGGVAYSLHVECATAGDGRCADDKFLVDAVESLAHVGGRGARP
jgi:hypothetical protein